MADGTRSGGLPAAFLQPGLSSFRDFLTAAAPELLPGAGSSRVGVPADLAPHGTTIVAVACAGGVVIAGDRRATAGNVIAQRDMQKVFRADEHSAIGIAGAAGVAIELVRLFQTELEHYEKLEGNALSLDGKANRLASMLRNNLPLAMQGLAVVPLFAGYDPDTGEGRIFSYDVTGGRYEEHSFHAVGSGSVFARGALKKRFRDGVTPDEAVRLSVESLFDAADDDSATGGPDLARHIYPIVFVVTAEGIRQVPDDEVGTVVQAVVDGRQSNPGG